MEFTARGWDDRQLMGGMWHLSKNKILSLNIGCWKGDAKPSAEHRKAMCCLEGRWFRGYLSETSVFQHVSSTVLLHMVHHFPLEVNGNDIIASNLWVGSPVAGTQASCVLPDTTSSTTNPLDQKHCLRPSFSPLGPVEYVPHSLSPPPSLQQVQLAPWALQAAWVRLAPCTTNLTHPYMEQL